MAYFRRFYGTAKLSTDQHITPWRTAAISPLACSHPEINYLRIQQRFFIGILKNVKIIRDETSIKYLKNRLFNRSALPIFPATFFFCIQPAIAIDHFLLNALHKHSDAFDIFFPCRKKRNVLCMTVREAGKKIQHLPKFVDWIVENRFFSISKFLFIGTISNRFAILIVNHAEWKWKFHFAINAFRPSNHETLFSCHIMNGTYLAEVGSGRESDWFKKCHK